VVRASNRVEKAIRLRSVPSPHENDRLSWPDREFVRCAGDHTQLEHNPRGCSDFESAGGRYNRPSRGGTVNSCVLLRAVAGDTRLGGSNVSMPHRQFERVIMSFMC
jgi:hypothetical protein